MKKKLITTLLATSIGFTPIVSCFLSLTSCNNQNDIKAIQLYPESDNIRPGETKIIRAVGLPNYQRLTDLSWSLIDTSHPEINIDSGGRLSVSTLLSTDEPIVVDIKATLPNNPDVFSITQMTVLPKPYEDFQGFLNNEIQFINYEGEVDSVKLDNPEGKTYVTSHNVDIFEGMTTGRPTDWTSWINFVPLVGGDVPNFMSFSLEGGAYVHHTIQWSEYNDSSWISSIPDFDTVANTYILDRIIVRFSCDTEAKLIINLTAWQNPEQDSQGMYSYIPETDEGEPNPIRFVEEGIYKLMIPCPGMDRQGTITKSLRSIYAFRPKFFYSDFEFEWETQPDLDPDIRNMFDYFQIGDAILVERPFDALRLYKMDVEYKIDLSRRQYTYEHWDYSDIQIGTMYAIDPRAGDAMNLEVWVTWEE